MNKKIKLSSVDHADYGGFGRVYRATLKGSRQEVAVKVLHYGRRKPERLLQVRARPSLACSYLFRCFSLLHVKHGHGLDFTTNLSFPLSVLQTTAPSVHVGWPLSYA